MKIATFNVNGIRPRLPRLPHLLQWLAKEQPDIVCLQELKAVDASFPIESIRDAGYGALWHGQSSWNGVAILAKGMDPLESRRGLPGDGTDTHTAATWKRPQTASSSAACTCPTAIRGQGRSSITSWRGSSA